jgi:hypothetical protein
LERSVEGSELRAIVLGHPLLDGYLAFVGARAATNTWLATAYDLKVFFEVVAKEPAEVAAADVFAFLAEQRTPRPGEHPGQPAEHASRLSRAPQRMGRRGRTDPGADVPRGCASPG